MSSQLKLPSETYHCGAIDLGATSGRVIVGSLSPKGLELSEAYRFPNQFYRLGNNYFWNVGGLFQEIEEGLRRAKKAFPELRSCGVDTWGVDTVLLNEEGRLAFPTHAYRDERTTDMHKKLKGSSEDIQLYQWTGIDTKTFNTGLQLAETIQSFPQVCEMVDQCLFLPDYFNFLLSGKASIEISIASTSQLLSVESPSWNEKALEFFKIPRRWFPQPQIAGSILGSALSEGLQNLQVIQTPGHDTSCAYEAIPMAEEGGKSMILSTGTWFLAGLHSESPLLGDEARAAELSNERTGQGSFRPCFGLLGLWLLEEVMKDIREKPSSDSEWAALVESAGNLPASPHLLDVKDQRLFSPASMKKTIDAMLAEKQAPPMQTLPEYFRLICDSLGAATADAMKQLEALTGQPFDSILVMGGGAKNKLLCQRMADYAGKKVIAYQLEGAASGNLAYQFKALGAIDSLRDFHDILRPRIHQKIYTPD